MEHLKWAVVVEQSNALVYFITSWLELKVEGSNPGFIIYFQEKVINALGLECACAVVGNVLLHMGETSSFILIKVDILGGRA